MKCCLVGDYGVGKTSLIRRYVYDVFDEKYLATIGAVVTKKTLGTIDGFTVDLMIWDLKGGNGESPEALSTNYVRSARGALLVADLTRPATIDRLEHWHAFITEHVGPIPMAIAGNKIDLVGDGGVDDPGPGFDLVEACGAMLDLPVHPTSAKSGVNVEPLFQALGRRMVEAARPARVVG